MDKKYIKDIPHLVKEYDFDKNKNIDFEKLTHGSNKKVWWTCSKGHSWCCVTSDKVLKNLNCPYCSGRRACKDNCLKTTHPHLAEEWDHDKNTLKPEEITHGSKKKIWWKCEQGHEWMSAPNTRSANTRSAKNSSCPYCIGRKVCKDNCLSTVSPDIAKEWSNKNIIKPTDVTISSGKKVWWNCSKGHEWEAQICNRTVNKTGCPYCAGGKACKDNCLKITHSYLLKEWDYTKNKISPEEITHGSKIKVWWKCSKDHEWKMNINARTASNQSCPYCAGKRACKDNSLATKHPELIKEWSSKNKLNPTDYTSGSNKKVWWECKKCKNHYLNSITNKSKLKQKCPYCLNRKVYSGNCLKNTHPDLIKEWNYEKNKIKPDEVTCGSKKRAWWKCKKCHYEWNTPISERQKYNCPKCKESKGEKKIAKILEDLKIRYKREYKFKELGQKRFDFALFQKNKRKPCAIIEYHGRQHYEPVRFSFKMSDKKCKDNLKNLKISDKLKKQYCIDNNIKYLEISYKNKELKETIKDFIEKYTDI